MGTDHAASSPISLFYRFADYKAAVIDLLQRVCTVSVETMRIVEAMKTI